MNIEGLIEPGVGVDEGRTLMQLHNKSTASYATTNLRIKTGNTSNVTMLTHYGPSYTQYSGFADYGLFLSTGPGAMVAAPNGNIRFQTGLSSVQGTNDRMTITNQGNVGIGTTNPNFAAHIERDGDGFGSSAFDPRTMLYLQNTSTNAAANTNLKIGSVGTTGTTNLTNFTPNYNIVPGYANCGMLSNTGGGLIIQTVQPLRLKVGANTPDRMTINGDGNVGIGTTTPVAKLQVTSGDVYIDDATKGIIMKSPNGNCWRVTIDNTGNMVRTAITCPQ